MKQFDSSQKFEANSSSNYDRLSHSPLFRSGHQLVLNDDLFDGTKHGDSNGFNSNLFSTTSKLSRHSQIKSSLTAGLSRLHFIRSDFVNGNARSDTLGDEVSYSIVYSS